MNEAQHEFGEERLRDLAQASLSLSAPEICHAVIEQLDQFTAVADQWDDITLMVVKLKPFDAV